MSSADAESQKITLRSSDGEKFEVEQAVAVQSQIIKYMIEDKCADDDIPVPNVTGKILSKVIDYCKRHVALPEKSAEDELKVFDTELVKVDQAMLFDMILAANYLDITSLLDLTCQTAADMIKGMTPEEIRKTFNIKDNFSPEEEEEVRRENPWAFDEGEEEEEEELPSLHIFRCILFHAPPFRRRRRHRRRFHPRRKQLHSENSNPSP